MSPLKSEMPLPGSATGAVFGASGCECRVLVLREETNPGSVSAEGQTMKGAWF